MNLLKFIIIIQSVFSQKRNIWNKFINLLSKIPYKTQYDIYYLKNNGTNIYKIYFIIDN
jgi:hypothetical protein